MPMALKSSRQLCMLHPHVDYKTAWGCPECVAAARKKISAAFRLSAALCALQDIEVKGVDYIRRDRVMDLVCKWRRENDAADKP